MAAVEMEANRVSEEERLVAELGRLDVGYLSRSTTLEVETLQPPDRLLANLVQQPSARVRSAIIALLLAHPEYASGILAALDRLSRDGRTMLKFLYTAAWLLQEQYGHYLREHRPHRWRRLPDLFSVELGVPSSGTPTERLRVLGRLCREATGIAVNWTGTYDQAARQLLRRWEAESLWKMSQQS